MKQTPEKQTIRERLREKKDKNNKYKIIIIMVDINPTIPITLNVNGLNIPIKRERDCQSGLKNVYTV